MDLTHQLLAVAVGVVGVARVTRLVTSDAYPPMVWLRMRWVNLTGARKQTQDWAPLLECPFCFAPYAAAADLTWGLWSGPSWWWWIVNLWAAGSYLASMIVVRDEPPSEE